MNNKYLPLFQPLTLGNMTMKNRINMAPMGLDSFNAQTIEYYARRARGGAGLVTTGACITTTLFHCELCNICDASNKAKIADLVEAVHGGGSKLCVMFTAGGGRNMVDSVTGEGYSASDVDVFGMPGKKCIPLTKEEIKQIMAETTASAATCAMCGVDAIMVHAHTGYLIDQFISSGWNKRDDEYGGSVENRMRFLMEYIDAIRAGVGPQFPIIVRFTIEHGVPGIREEGETEEMLKILASANINALDVDCGCYEAAYEIFPSYYCGDATELHVTDVVKKLGITLPVFNAGNHTPDTAVAAITEGKMDVVSFGRQLLADPDLPNKLLNGAEEEIRPCIRCNVGCLTRSFVRGTCCAVNAETGMELRALNVKPCAEQKVAIIGGGIAGLEAARVAAERGAKVVLFEKGERLGGVARDIATPDWKYRFRDLFAWYDLQMEKLGVEVVLNKEVQGDEPELAEASQIFVATGSKTLMPPIKGIDGANVISVLDAHRNVNAIQGENIVVCGGGLSGCELALELAEDGKKVSVIEMRDKFAPDAATFAGWVLMMKLAGNPNITLIPNTKVMEINDAGVVVEENGATKTIPCDMAVNAFGMRSENELGMKMMQKYPGKVSIIGDANKVKCIFDAVHDGYNAGTSLN